ncbi:MAG: CHAD domain-containing protein [Desulfopila sp.]|nr:CHAD domain-containing protein [Desulfopila sp.]
MKKNCCKEFSAVDEAGVDAALENAGQSYLLADRRKQRLYEYYYDTFDWSLYSSGYHLKRRGGQLYLGLPDKSRMTSGGVTARKSYLHNDLPESELRTVLHSVAGIRALCEIVAAKITRSSIDIRNKDRKTVARLQIDEAMAEGNGKEALLSPFVRLWAMKGYEKAFARVAADLEKAGLIEAPYDQSDLKRYLTAVGREVLDYSSKYDLTQPREIRAGQAVSSICLYLLEMMEKNVSGVLDDIDSEFLHDFRVAMRRTRSLLSQLKNYLPEEKIQRFLDEFKWLGTLTGPVRDLDVYLLEKDDYASMLPEQLHGGLDAFFQDLEKKREKDLTMLRQGLASQRYRDFIESWRIFLEDEKGICDWEPAREDCFPIARRIIGKRYRQILKKGGKLGEHSPDEDLHRLRIQGKKLRYLLEFFASFFDEKEIQHFHKQLKKLQNNLGDFNDISVQLEMLEKYRTSIKSRSRRAVEIAAALGGLVTHLAEEHKNVRAQFESTFAGFASSENREKFDSLLGE